MTKTSGNILIAVRVVALVGLAIVGGCMNHKRPPVPPLDRHDSPVDVAGGSVHGYVKSSNNWKEVRRHKLYGAESNNKYNLILNGLIENQGGTPAPESLNSPGGWIVIVSTQDVAEDPKADTISFCSDITPPQGFPGPASLSCSAAGSLGPKFVYLQANGGTTFDVVAEDELRFHDLDQNCADHGHGEREKCEKISTVRIFTRANNQSGINQMLLKCDPHRPKKECWVRAGQ